MTTIVELVEKINSISDSKNKSKIFQTIKKNKENINEAKRIYKECKETKESINSVFSKFKINRDITIKTDIDTLVNILPEQSDLLTNKTLSKKIEEKIRIIKDKCSESLKDIKEQWENFLKDKIYSYIQMAYIARNLDVENSIETNSQILNGALLDCNEQSLRRVKTAINEIEKDINKFPLEVEEKNFLVDAMAGNADAELLYNPKIKEFIERYNLINKIKIKISNQ
jgi:hypothetical protein